MTPYKLVLRYFHGRASLVAVADEKEFTLALQDEDESILGFWDAALKTRLVLGIETLEIEDEAIETEIEEARAELFADPDNDYGDECVIRVAGGNNIHVPAYPAECDYVRIVDGAGIEQVYWDSLEWRESETQSKEVMGAIFGAVNQIVDGDPQTDESEG